MLKQLLLVLALFGGNGLLPHWSASPVVDSIYRTAIIGGCWLYGAYKLRISEEFVLLIRKLLRK